MTLSKIQEDALRGLDSQLEVNSPGIRKLAVKSYLLYYLSLAYKAGVWEGAKEK